MNLLEVTNLKVYFPIKKTLFGQVRENVRAVDDVSFAVEEGETLGLVGESGCGKTTVARAVVKLVEPTEGVIRFGDADLAKLNGMELRSHRRRLQMIFQDPVGSLNPRLTVEETIGEPLDIHHLAANPSLRRQRVNELLEAVGLEPEQRERYPHEFSGGQRQRIGIARALAVEPKLIVCDEPVSALDVSVQAQIVNLLQEIQEKQGVAYLFIAHDLAVVEHISHRVMVMYLGRVVESAASRELVSFPLHPYTQALMAAVPEPERDLSRRRIVLGGEMPSPIHPPPGCPFHPRCPIAEARCRAEIPPLREVRPRHWAACHLAK